MNFLTLAPILTNKERLVEFCLSNGYLPAYKICLGCLGKMYLIYTSAYPDGIFFQCVNCKKQQRIKINTIFGITNLRINEMIVFIYLFLNFNLGNSEFMTEFNISEKVSIKIKKALRNVCLGIYN